MHFHLELVISTRDRYKVFCVSIMFMSEGEWVSRTSEYVKHLQEVGVPLQRIEKTRINTNTLVKMGLDDTLSSHFHHEARNAFGPLTIDVPGVEFDSADFKRLRQRLLNVKNATEWFKEDGPLSRQEIVDFLDEAEKQGEWDIPTARRVRQMVQPLFDKFPK